MRVRAGTWHADAIGIHGMEMWTVEDVGGIRRGCCVDALHGGQQ